MFIQSLTMWNIAIHDLVRKFLIGHFAGSTAQLFVFALFICGVFLCILM